MSNSYKYIDPVFTYIDSKTGLLKNIQNITDTDVLPFVESGAVTKRLQELYQHPIKTKSINSFFEIHRHLFQDIYEWAGKVVKNTNMGAGLDRIGSMIINHSSK